MPRRKRERASATSDANAGASRARIAKEDQAAKKAAEKAAQTGRWNNASFEIMNDLEKAASNGSDELAEYTKEEFLKRAKDLKKNDPRFRSLLNGADEKTLGKIWDQHHENGPTIHRLNQSASEQKVKDEKIDGGEDTKAADYGTGTKSGYEELGEQILKKNKAAEAQKADAQRTFFNGGAGTDIKAAEQQYAKENKARQAEEAANYVKRTSSPFGKGHGEESEGSYASYLKQHAEDRNKALKDLRSKEGDHTKENQAIERQYSIDENKAAIENAIKTDTFDKSYSAAHEKNPNLLKADHLRRMMRTKNADNFFNGMANELKLGDRGRARMLDGIDSMQQARNNIAQGMREIRAKRGAAMRAVKSKDGLSNRSIAEKQKILGYSDERMNAIRDRATSSKLGRIKDHVTGFFGRNTNYAQEQEKRVHRALDKRINASATTGERNMSTLRELKGAISHRDYEAITDAASATGGKHHREILETARKYSNTKGTGAAKKSGGHHWKAKGGAALALLALGGVLGNMMGNHGEQTNAQMYNPNPQPQYYS